MAPLQDGSIPKWNGSTWICEEDRFVPDTVLEKTKTLQDLGENGNCKDGQVLKWKDGAWICADDLATEALPNTDRLRDLNCNEEGQILTWNGSDWTCQNDKDTTLATGKNCETGEALVKQGEDWKCLGLGYQNDLVLDLASGGQSNCVIMGDESVKCWGSNVYAQLGLGNDNNMGDETGEMGLALPSLNLGTTAKTAKIRHVAVGRWHGCATFSDGRAKCWGYHGNELGELGIGSGRGVLIVGNQSSEMGDELEYVKIGASDRVRKIALRHEFSCALFEDHSVKCWGANESGQIGIGSNEKAIASNGDLGENMKSVELGGLAKDIAVGDNHACAILVGGTLICWGKNDYGQLGIDSTTNATSPQEVKLGQKVQQVDLNHRHTCAVLVGGDVKCWGRGGAGALGQKNLETIGDGLDADGNTVKEIPGLDPIDLNGQKALQVAVGRDHSCVLLESGQVTCWGYNGYGQLGWLPLIYRDGEGSWIRNPDGTLNDDGTRNDDGTLKVHTEREFYGAQAGRWART